MTSRSEFDILRNSHRFLRETDDEEDTWEDQLARKYYDSLWKEFAVCDLKHYKSGNFALRWRTESEVLSGAGERSCGNTRCPLHTPPPDEEDRIPGLATLELPFAYEEHGEKKSALVKIVLCARCVRKLMWKREREKAAARDLNLAFGLTAPITEAASEPSQGQSRKVEERRRERDGRANKESRRERHSRSRSPREDSKRRDRRRRPQSP